MSCSILSDITKRQQINEMTGFNNEQKNFSTDDVTSNDDLGTLKARKEKHYFPSLTRNHGTALKKKI